MNARERMRIAIERVFAPLRECQSPSDYIALSRNLPRGLRLCHVFFAALEHLRPAPYALFALLQKRSIRSSGHGLLSHPAFFHDDERFAFYVRYVHDFERSHPDFLKNAARSIDDMWPNLFYYSGDNVRGVLRACLLHGFFEHFGSPREIFVHRGRRDLLVELQQYENDRTQYRSRYSGILAFVIATASLNLPTILAVVVNDWLYAVNDVLVAPQKPTVAWKMASATKQFARLTKEREHAECEKAY